MPPTEFETHDSIVFLSMFWSGGKRLTLSDLIFVIDWVNRSWFSSSEMEGTLNRLLATELIEHDDDTFSIPKSMHDKFEEYRRKQRRGRFKDARAFLKLYEPLPKTIKRVSISEARYRKATDEYHRRFDAAAAKLKPKKRSKQRKSSE